MPIQNLKVGMPSGRIFLVDIELIKDGSFSVRVDGKRVTGSYSSNKNDIIPKINHLSSQKVIFSDFPGVISHIHVSEGEKVSLDTKLLSIMAMKMENVLFAHAGGTIKKIYVKKDEKVDARQKLMEIE